jgi:DNA repair protein RecO (recombination protein O)
VSQTYRATGIILKGIPLGESDRLVTIFSPECGLLRASAPGSRKHKSILRGRTELFVVNQFFLAKGRSLDRIVQVETLESFPGLSRDLNKLAASQYLAELALTLTPRDHPQAELYPLFLEHLKRIETLERAGDLYAYLAQAVYHFLAISGICPQVHACCLSREPLATDNRDPTWRVGFSFEAGGTIDLARKQQFWASGDRSLSSALSTVLPPIDTKLGAVELRMLQHLGNPRVSPQLLDPDSNAIGGAWARVERLLRNYAQYQLGRSFRAAQFIDSLALLDF